MAGRRLYFRVDSLTVRPLHAGIRLTCSIQRLTTFLGVAGFISIEGKTNMNKGWTRENRMADVPGSINQPLRHWSARRCRMRPIRYNNYGAENALNEGGNFQNNREPFTA